MNRSAVVLGAGGQLGRQLVAALSSLEYGVVALSRAELDVTADDAPAAIRRLAPSVVVNAAAWTDVDGCARDPGRALETNGSAPGRLAAAAASTGARFVQISTNEVFDGERGEYRETDLPNPVNPYGASKLAGELAVTAANPNHLIVRTAWIFGPDGNNFPRKIIGAAQRAMASGTSLRVVADEFGNPTWAPDLAARIGEAVSMGTTGILHLAGTPPASRFDWAAEILARVAVHLERIHLAEFQRVSSPPPHATLSMARAAEVGILPMDWRPASGAYARTLLADGAA